MARISGEELRRRFEVLQDVGGGARATWHSTFGLLWGIIKVPITIFVIILIILLFLVVPLFIWRCSQTGVCQTQFQHFSFKFKETGVKQAGEYGLLEIFNFIFSGAYDSSVRGSGSFDTEQTETEHFIEIKDIYVRPGYYSEGMPIDIKIRAVAHNITHDSEINVSCELEGYKGDIEYIYNLRNDNGNHILKKGIREQKFTIDVIFVDGLKIKRDIQSFNGKCFLRYKGKAESIWRPYLLHSYYLDAFVSKGKDPLGSLRRTDSSLRGNKVSTIPKYFSSIMLRFDVFEDMPFTEGRLYSMDIFLDELEKFSGRLYSLEELNLYVPLSVNLNLDQRFCSFAPSGERVIKNGKNYIVYRVSDSFLKNINVDCNDRNVLRDVVTREQCLQRYKENVRASCGLYFDVDRNNPTPYTITLMADASYIYELEKPFLVDVVKSFGSGFGGDCSEYNDEQKCVEVVGCKPIYENGKFRECVLCGRNEGCEDYDDKNYCLKHPCEGYGGICVYDESTGECRRV